VHARHAVCHQAEEASRQSQPASGESEMKHKIPYFFGKIFQFYFYTCQPFLIYFFMLFFGKKLSLAK
jgi:hypothetical protein